MSVEFFALSTNVYWVMDTQNEKKSNDVDLTRVREKFFWNRKMHIDNKHL